MHYDRTGATRNGTKLNKAQIKTASMLIEAARHSLTFDVAFGMRYGGRGLASATEVAQEQRVAALVKRALDNGAGRV